VISKPRTALGGALLAAVLLVSGCQTRVGAAATVGDDRISTKTFNATYNTAAASSVGVNPVSLRRNVLAELVQLQRAKVVAKRLGVATTAGDVDVALTQVQAQLSQQNPLPDNLVQLAAQLQAIETNLGNYYVKHGGTADQDHVLGFQVKDKATGQRVAAQVARDGSNLDKLAAANRSDKGTSTALGTADISRIPELKGLRAGQATEATFADNSTGTVVAQYYVLYVDAQFDQTDLTAAMNAVKVRVNPRFGTWSQDPATGQFGVQPATSDIVAPVPSVAPSAAPSGAAPAPSAPAPTAAAPSAAGPSAPAVSSAVAPSATAAPAPTATPSAASSSAASSSAAPSAAASS